MPSPTTCFLRHPEAGRPELGDRLRGNLLGGVFFAWLLWFSVTKGGGAEVPPLLDALRLIAEKKTAYRHHGVHGWLVAVVATQAVCVLGCTVAPSFGPTRRRCCSSCWSSGSSAGCSTSG